MKKGFNNPFAAELPRVAQGNVKFFRELAQQARTQRDHQFAHRMDKQARNWQCVAEGKDVPTHARLHFEDRQPRKSH